MISLIAQKDHHQGTKTHYNQMRGVSRNEVQMQLSHHFSSQAERDDANEITQETFLTFFLTLC
jgi:hypothetical protein